MRPCLPPKGAITLRHPQPAPVTPQHVHGRVYQRTDKLAVGALSINVTGCPCVPDAPAGQPSPLAAGLQAAMAALVPSTAVFPLSVPWVGA